MGDGEKLSRLSQALFLSARWRYTLETATEIVLQLAWKRLLADRAGTLECECNIIESAFIPSLNSAMFISCAKGFLHF